MPVPFEMQIPSAVLPEGTVSFEMQIPSAAFEQFDPATSEVRLTIDGVEYAATNVWTYSE